MLIVEDGTGLENADSLVSVDQANAYAEAFGRSDWESLANPKKEIRLRQASLYVQTTFVVDASPLNVAQAFAFPIQTHGIPMAVMRAVMEVATAPGLPEVFPTTQARAIASESKSLDGLKKSVTYFDNTKSELFPIVNRLMTALPYVSAAKSSSGKGMSSGVLVRA